MADNEPNGPPPVVENPAAAAATTNTHWQIHALNVPATDSFIQSYWFFILLGLGIVALITRTIRRRLAAVRYAWQSQAFESAQRQQILDDQLRQARLKQITALSATDNEEVRRRLEERQRRDTHRREARERAVRSVVTAAPGYWKTAYGVGQVLGDEEGMAITAGGDHHGSGANVHESGGNESNGSGSDRDGSGDEGTTTGSGGGLRKRSTSGQ